ncbi:hypothetical protein HK098_000525 [Nowakowskiella sp. JEL0407]|nr:hypothetical protein HK098_000525 [Nowakowskiella sp. JEL0407]
MCARRWRVPADSVPDPTQPSSFPISDADKSIIKQIIIPTIIVVDLNARKSLLEAVSSILDEEYDQGKWPEFLPTCQQLIQSSQFPEVVAGLDCVYVLCKLFMYSSEMKRLEPVIQGIVPLLLPMGKELLANGSDDAANTLKVILKIYQRSHYSYNADNLEHPQLRLPWISLMMDVIAKPVPSDPRLTTDEEKEGRPIWKAKNWAYKIIYKIVSRYRDSYERRNEQRKNESTEAFQQRKEIAEAFVTQLLPEILNAYMRQVELLSKGEWLSQKAKQFIAQLLNVGINFKSTWTVIRPQLQNIITYFIFPTLLVTETDMDLWEDAPVEYVVQKNAFFDPTPSSAAGELLHNLIKKRKAASFEPIMQFINHVLADYQSKAPEARDPRVKDAGLHMICFIVEFIMTSPFKEIVEESLFVPHVIPELVSPHGFVQERILHETFITVLKLVQHPKVPVQAEAASTIDAFLFHPEVPITFVVLPLLEPHVPDTIKVLLNLTSVHKLDSLSSVLATIVAKFPKIVTPFAIELGHQLALTYMKMLEESNQNMDPNDITPLTDVEDEQTEAAISLLQTIQTLMDAVAKPDNAELQLQFEQHILPALEYTFKNMYLDAFDFIFEIIDSSASSLKAITPSMAVLLPHILEILSEENFDVVGENVNAALDSYLMYGADIISKNPEYMQKIIGVIKLLMDRPLVFGDPSPEDFLEKEEEQKLACSLIETMLLYMPGQIDHVSLHSSLKKFFVDFYPPGITGIFRNRFERSVKENRRDAKNNSTIQQIVNAFYYNPALTFQFLEQHNATATVFKGWFETIDSLSRVHDKKLSILALCKILSLPPNQIPAVVQQGWGQTFEAVLKIFDSLPKALQDRKKEIEAAEEDEEYEEYEVLETSENHIDDDEDTNEGPAHWETAEGIDLGLSGFSFPSALDADAVLEEDPYFASPLDDQDAYKWFQQLWATLPQHPIGSQVIGSIDQSNPLGQKIQLILQLSEEAASKVEIPATINQ